MAEKLSVDAALVVVPPVFDSIAAYGIGVIAAGVALIWIVMMSRRNARRAVWLSLGAFCVMTISALAATSGLLSRFDVIPPPTMVMIVAVLIMSLAIALSRFGRTISTEVSLASLIGLQIFRLPLEMVMHHAGNAGIMPVELSYSSRVLKNSC